MQSPLHGLREAGEWTRWMSFDVTTAGLATEGEMGGHIWFVGKASRQASKQCVC